MLRLGNTKPQLHLGNILFLLTMVSLFFWSSDCESFELHFMEWGWSWTNACCYKGALQVAKPAGRLKIGKEAVEGTASNFHLCLPSETYLTCR